MVMEYQVIYHLQRSCEINNWTVESVYSGFTRACLSNQLVFFLSPPLVQEVC